MPCLTSWSSVSGSIIATKIARSKSIPCLIRVAVYTNNLVETPSSKSCPFNARILPAMRTKIQLYPFQVTFLSNYFNF